MPQGPCRLAECTYNMTKVCVLNRPVEECSNRRSPGPVVELEDVLSPNDDDASSFVSEDRVTADIGGAVLPRPDETPTLPSSLTMGLEDAAALMKRRKTTMIGIVGLPDSGKTACLVSAYLLLSSGRFDEYDFADSATLMAFEQIARGSRQWVKGDEPGKLTVHTEMVDDRQAGFLHFRMRRRNDGRFFDMLMPDLPGEWSKALIEKNDSDRLKFLESASVVWLMVDGRAFSDRSKRQYAVHRAELLVARLAAILPTPKPRVFLVPSWQDIGEFPVDAYQRIRREGDRCGMSVSLSPIASFSFGEMAPGTGISKLIDATLNHCLSAPDFWPDTEVPGVRKLGYFRRDV